MDPAIVKSDFELTSRADALFHPARPKTPTHPSKNDAAQKHEKTETVYQSANFVTVNNNPSQLKSQKNVLSLRDPIFSERRKMHVAYPVAAQSFPPPPPTLDEVFSTFHSPISTRTKCQLHDTHAEHPPHHTRRMNLARSIFTCYKLAFYKISSKSPISLIRMMST
jgi:hypothetical protein